MSFAYVVCGCKSWNRRSFDDVISKLPGVWRYISNKDELTAANLKKIQPRRVFFLHWSWIVPKEIIDAFECVNFHMTDLPYGRGGSPLQNLILSGKKETVLTAHRMTGEVDAGPVYLKQPLSLAGSAEEILKQSSALAAEMIGQIMRDNPKPEPQKGAVAAFRRRTPDESEIPGGLSQGKLLDFIRMLDAEGYPKAFFRYKGFRCEFRNARFDGDAVQADATIIPENPL